MTLKEFLANPENEHTLSGNPSVKCNALAKTEKALNCQLSPDQATDLARYLLDKAQLLRRNGIEDGAVQLWSVGTDDERLSLGLIALRKGQRRKKRVKITPARAD